MIYQIKVNDNILFDTRTKDFYVEDPILSLEINKVGTLTFSIYPDHPYFNRIDKLISKIEAYRNDKVVFRGRVICDKQTLYNCKNIECESVLSYLNDSIVKPQIFQGSPTELFAFAISNHNSQVEDRKKIKLGKITISDPNDYIRRSWDDYITTLDLINTRCIDSLGGYIIERYEEDGTYLDWLANIEKISSQKIEAGNNLMDIFTNNDASNIFSVIVPLGANLEQEDGTYKRVTIESENDGVDYLVNNLALQKYGWIVAPISDTTWDDVTLPANLKKKGEEYLNKNCGLISSTVELTTLDLSFCDINIESFFIYENIYIFSKLHNFDAKYLLKKIIIPFMRPQDIQITLGETKTTITGINLGNKLDIDNVIKRVGTIEADYVTNKQLPNIVDESIKESSIIKQLPGEILISVEQEYTKIESFEAELDSLSKKIRPIRTLTGTNLISIEDGSDNYFKEIIIDGICEQTVTEESPSPSNRSIIKNLSQKNILPILPINENKNGLTIIRNNDDTITITGHTMAGTGIYLSDAIFFNKNTKYTASVEVLKGSCTKYFPEANFAILIYPCYNADNNILAYFKEDDKKINITFEGSGKLGKFYLWIPFNDSTTNDYANFEDFTFRVQIEENDVAHDYVPYGSWLKINTEDDNNMHEYLIDLKENELCSIGSIKDRLILAYNNNENNYHAILTKKIGKLILTGINEDWYFSPWGNIYKLLLDDYNLTLKNQFPSSILFNNIISSHFKEDVCDDKTGLISSKSKDGTFSFCYQNNVPTLYIKNDICNQDIDAFKNWLNENNVIIYYELDQEKIIDLGVINMPKTYETNTNISVSSDLEVDLEATYYTIFSGKDGKTQYLHVMFSADGKNFIEADDEYELGKRPSIFRGEYLDFTKEDSLNFEDYIWYKPTEELSPFLNELQKQINNNSTLSNNNYQELIDKLNNKASIDNVTTINNQVIELQNSTSQTLTIIEDMKVNGVSQVRTENNFTFDKNGLHLDELGAPVSNTLDAYGMEIVDKTGFSQNTQFFSGYVTKELVDKNPTLASFLGQTITFTNDIYAKNFVKMQHGRWENTEHQEYGPGIGAFIGGDS